MPRGPKKHLKRLNAPKHWMLDKLGGVFVRLCIFCDSDVFESVPSRFAAASVPSRLISCYVICRPRSRPLDHIKLATAYLSWSFCATGSSACPLPFCAPAPLLCLQLWRTELPAAILSNEYYSTVLFSCFLETGRAVFCGRSCAVRALPL